MKNIVISQLGTTLDKGKGKKRWGKWRPTISICMHEELLVDELHLLYPKRFKELAELISKDLKQVSPETKVVLHLIEFNNPWDFSEVYSTLHDFCQNFTFKPEENNYLLHITTGTHVAQICMFLLAESRYFPGQLIQTGPQRRHENGMCPGEFTVIDLDLSKYDCITKRFEKEICDDISFLKCGIMTRNEDFNKLIERIEYVSVRSNEPMLLTGPTGAGKSQLARRIYELKKQRHLISGDFVEVNCATLRGDITMSTLFGHQKGAFTGAIQARPGLLRTADKGILFLDEIGELGLNEQAMLLRAIEEKSFMPMGSDCETSSDFELICGTRRNLAEEVQNGHFREDLLARINLWTFDLPGLAKRREDIEPNLDFELHQISNKLGSNITINRQARIKFLAFSESVESKWLANFRDLNAAVTRMGTLANGGRIDNNLVNEETARLKSQWESTGTKENFLLLREVLSNKTDKLDLFDQVQLEKVIEICRQSLNLSEAGRKLFANSRTQKKVVNDADRLKKYLAKFDLSWQEVHR